LEQKHVVLCGAPGLGKTRLLQHFAEVACAPVRSARQFLLEVHDPAFRDKLFEVPLFIDALDEARGRSGDDVLDDVARTLIKLGRPAFVLATRSADWHGASDLAALRTAVSAGQTLVEAALVPFDDDDVMAALAGAVPDPAAFIERVRRAGVAELLANPETLRLLVEAVDNDTDPLTKRDVLDRAVHAMLRETNAEHARQVRLPAEQLRAEAERLCALRLIVGADGFAIAPGVEDEGFIGIDQLRRDETHRQRVEAVIRTRLFEASSDGTVRGPHRLVAEYLGGAHLARLVDHEGLPAARVLALLTGTGGRPVTALRGLFASFATQCERQRDLLLARDPAGLLAYGDAGIWRTETRRAFLAVIREHARTVPRFPFSRRALACVHLADPMLVEDYRAVLREPEACPELTYIVLAALAHGRPLPELADDLLACIVEPLRWAELRSDALDALLNCAPGRREELTAFVRRLSAADYRRDDFDICGHILYKGFPEWIDVDTALSILKPINDESFAGFFQVFWKARAWQVWPGDGLLNAAASGMRWLTDGRQRHRGGRGDRVDHISGFVLGCVSRWLEEDGIDPGAHDVADWLLTCAEDRHASMQGELWQRIDTCLDRPDTAATLAARHVECLNQPGQAKDLRGWRIGHLRQAEDLPGWRIGHLRSEALHRAFADALVERYRSERDPERRPQWLREALWLHFSFQGDHEHLDRLLTEFFDDPTVANHIPALTTCSIAHVIEMAADKEEWAAEDRARSQSDRCYLEEYLSAHRERLCPAHRDGLAAHALHRWEDGNTDWLQPIANAWGERVAKAVRDGLIEMLSQETLPSAREIGEIEASEKAPYQWFSILGAMEIVHRDNGAAWQRIASEVQASALALDLLLKLDDRIENVSHERRFAWAKDLARARPELVREVMIDLCRGYVSVKPGELPNAVYALTHEDRFAAIRSEVAAALLADYGANLKAAQLIDLAATLLSADDHVRLDPLVERFVGQASDLAPIPAALWGAVAVARGREAGWTMLEAALEADAAVLWVLRDLAEAIEEMGAPAAFMPDGAMDLERAIRLLAPLAPPTPTPEGVVTGTTNPFQAAEWVDGLLARLAALPTPEAQRSLQRLAAEESMQPRRERILRLIDAQAQLLADTSFVAPAIAEAIATLRDGPPANVADLKALVLDILCDVQDELRGGRTSGWRAFWNVKGGRHPKPDRPRSENECRDRLVERMQERLLARGVTTQTEQRQANDTSADIGFRALPRDGRPFQLPVECKLQTNRQLWTAAESQLAARYTIDPDSGGYGVYLVFWHGADDQLSKRMPAAPDGAPRLADPSALRGALSLAIGTERRDRLSVVVLDVSPPST